MNINVPQDWTPVLLTGKKPVSKQNGVGTKYNIEERKNDEAKSAAAKMYALENSEDITIQTIPLSISQEISKARVAKGLTQKELAQRLNLQPAVITSYENGKAIPDNQMLQKIARELGTKFSKIPKVSKKD